MQLLGIDPPRQAHPENEAACRPGHLGTLGEVLLHCQLIGTEVLAIFLAYVAQMPVVAAILQVGCHAHLRHATGRVGGKRLQALNLVLVTPGDHPAHPHARGQGLGEA
ncbi:hypothetical protein D3C80_1871970 [compost metagenome]